MGIQGTAAAGAVALLIVAGTASSASALSGAGALDPGASATDALEAVTAAACGSDTYSDGAGYSRTTTDCPLGPVGSSGCTDEFQTAPSSPVFFGVAHKSCVTTLAGIGSVTCSHDYSYQQRFPVDDTADANGCSVQAGPLTPVSCTSSTTHTDDPYIQTHTDSCRVGSATVGCTDTAVIYTDDGHLPPGRTDCTIAVAHRATCSVGYHLALVAGRLVPVVDRASCAAAV